MREPARKVVDPLAMSDVGKGSGRAAAGGGGVVEVLRVEGAKRPVVRSAKEEVNEDLRGGDLLLEAVDGKLIAGDLGGGGGGIKDDMGREGGDRGL